MIHPGGAVDRHSTDYKMKSILLFSPAGRVVSRCFVRFRAASFPDPGDNAHLAGCFNPDKLTVKDSYTMTEADKDALRMRDIVLLPVVEM